MQKNMLVTPIVKWVGGKRQLLSEIMPLIPSNFTTYVEPFLGGGAVLFKLQPDSAIISDSNEELINVYKAVKDDPEGLILLLEEHEKNNSEPYFYNIRGLDRNSDYSSFSSIQRAARIIYLNKTCYNGLYRVNSAGQFNSPYGRYKNPNIVNALGIRAMSKYFNSNSVAIRACDYKESLRNLDEDAFVYLDPPYMPISSSASFTGYTEGGFGYDRQVELKNECDKLRNSGIRFLLSNSDCEVIRNLYKDYTISTVHAKRSVNSNASKRGEVNEVLISYGI
ncbi:MAG: DNA adenine methylase [Clostridiales bacterium]|nr:DNA adenine methylase [Clostridiales bacterium]